MTLQYVCLNVIVCVCRPYLQECRMPEMDEKYGGVSEDGRRSRERIANDVADGPLPLTYCV